MSYLSTSLRSSLAGARKSLDFYLFSAIVLLTYELATNYRYSLAAQNPFHRDVFCSVFDFLHCTLYCRLFTRASY